MIAVAETKNITLAAQRLNITQPRLPRGVELTAFGERLLPHALQIAAGFLQASEDLNVIKKGHLDTLRIGAGPLFHMRYLGTHLVQLRKEFPETAITLQAELNTRNLQNLRDGEIDVVFGTTEHLSKDDQLQFLEMTTVEQGVVLSSKHPLARRKSISAKQLVGLEWIVYSAAPDYEDLLRSYYRSLGLATPKVALHSSSMALALQMVAQGDYALSLPTQLKPVVKQYETTLVELSPPMAPRASGAYLRRSSKDYPIIRRLIEIVSQALQKS